jgi:hypothetical protein
MSDAITERAKLLLHVVEVGTNLDCPELRSQRSSVGFSYPPHFGPRKCAPDKAVEAAVILGPTGEKAYWLTLSPERGSTQTARHLTYEMNARL